MAGISKAERERRAAEAAAAGQDDVEQVAHDAEQDAGEPEQATGQVKTVRMVLNEPEPTGRPTAADVHPDEVENWKAHGWTLAE
ncbi:hypothetical protein [Caldimonas brevitalea]|uniref:Uncharacterized protein n=1 Tax=Caldimonas brevitalea TaxID=413882 RepID=A0A0G3BLI1_9BURK|nr:hypothetical protein [Caldimonas brevitalea]AKJ28833.1 hypothetical protein AAW51_2142 [Caldimonas brevitalea]